MCVGASCSWSRHTRVCVFGLSCIISPQAQATTTHDPSLISSNLASLGLNQELENKCKVCKRKDLNEVILIDLGFGRAPIPLRVGGWGISAIGARTYARGRPGGRSAAMDDAHAHVRGARGRRGRGSDGSYLITVFCL